jgi:hypothetical protein
MRYHGSREEGGLSKGDSTEPPCRLLITEDDWLISALLEDQPAELNLEIAGMAATVKDALVETTEVDAALPDMKLHETFSGEVADALWSRRIPFLFVSGYAKVPDRRYDSVPVLLKPFDVADLDRALQGVLPPKCLHGSPAVRASADQPRIG